MKFIINGGNKLVGSIRVGGSKNAATKMMMASLLTDEEVTLSNFPFIGDTDITADLCEVFGSKIKKDIKNNILKIETPKIENHNALSLTRRNRIPILAIGPLLSRVGVAIVPVVGGDKIGARPVDLHIQALKALGAEIEESIGYFKASAPNGLVGANINFPFPSVGATENAILSSVCAKGKTVIKNSAVEPEIIGLIKMLQKMGAIIGLGANRIIYIDGVESLHGARHHILPDRNEAASLAILGPATDGRVTLEGVNHEGLLTFLNVLRKIGVGFDIDGDSMTFFRGKKLRGVSIETDTHPGFMTDWQQPLAVLLTQADGKSIIHETIYEDRFGYADDLNKMGADIQKSKECLGDGECRFFNSGYFHSAVINGPTKLHGEKIKVRDLRSGMAHVISALVADGCSEIDGVEEIDRGYENLDGRLISLGADIKRIK